MGYVIETEEQRNEALSKKMMEYHNPSKGVFLPEALEMAKRWYYGKDWISDADELVKKRAGKPAYVRYAPLEGENIFKRFFRKLFSKYK